MVICNRNNHMISIAAQINTRMDSFIVVRRSLLALLLVTLFCAEAVAQKPFTEGVITYKVKLTSPDNKQIDGVYTFIVKGNLIRKELKLSNGYEDVVLLNCDANTVYSLQNQNGKKFAIELSMPDMVKRQDKYKGYNIKDEVGNSRNIAGYAAYKGDINYNNGSVSEVYYTKDWSPLQSITFERFPNAKFLPLQYTLTDEQNMTMLLEMEKLQDGPVENALFRIPADYKMISYNEYKQLSR